MKRVFDQVYAPATLGLFLREFTHGHCLQLASAARAHLVNVAERTDLLTGIETQAYIDIDSLLRPVFGHAKQGASFGHAKIAGRVLLRRGLSLLATTISTPTAAPVLAGIRLRSGKTGSGKGAPRWSAKPSPLPVPPERPVRSWSAVIRPTGNSAVVGACLKAKVRFSVVLPKNRAVVRAIGAIPDQAWTPVHYPGAVVDPETGELISDAEVAEVPFTAFASTKCPVIARLVVRRVRDQNKLEELFPVWRCHPFLTNSTDPTVEADLTTGGTRSSRPSSPT